MPTLVIVDHSTIPASDRDLALKGAEHDPDGQVFPWRLLYPLVGQTVYAYTAGRGGLWSVVSRERGRGGAVLEDPLVHLVSVGSCAEVFLYRSELRPVTWTPEQEVAMFEEEMQTAPTRDM